ncbi:MAG: response regulator transcription factor [Desulfobacterales bacterium]|jgi:DNA-binding NarL/FixJ family response regulator
MRKTRVLLADDHQIVLEGLKSLLEQEFEIVGMVVDGNALVNEALKLHPDVIVVDISMPLLNGIEAVRQIRSTDERIKVVFLTMHPEVTYATMAFDAGASGYVLKNAASRELITAINEAMKGRTYVTPRIAGELMQTYKKTRPGDKIFEKKLTHRQGEILQLLAEGHSAKEIANMLSISPRTVETHKYNMMEGLNLKTTADLIKFAIKHGLTAI